MPQSEPPAVTVTFAGSGDAFGSGGCYQACIHLRPAGAEFRNMRADAEYKGINSRWRVSEHQMFEVQFHTEASFTAKQENHGAYERLRTLPPDHEEVRELRSDVHTMFDRGYLAIDDNHRLLVSPRLRGELGNGDQFYARAGEVIDLPNRKIDRPQREFLRWHMDTVFKAS